MSHLFESPMGFDGFGEGSFKALFESIEREQIVRGVERKVIFYWKGA